MTLGDLHGRQQGNFPRRAWTKVILDLRGNSGGTVTAAQALAGLWLDNQPLMTEQRGGKIDKTIKTTGKPLLGDKKTIVLINGGSASASKIVAGALSGMIKRPLSMKKAMARDTRSIMNRIFLDIKHSALCIQIVHAFPFLFCYPYILCLSLLLPAKNV